MQTLRMVDYSTDWENSRALTRWVNFYSLTFFFCSIHHYTQILGHILDLSVIESYEKSFLFLVTCGGFVKHALQELRSSW